MTKAGGLSASAKKLSTPGSLHGLLAAVATGSSPSRLDKKGVSSQLWLYLAMNCWAMVSSYFHRKPTHQTALTFSGDSKYSLVTASTSRFFICRALMIICSSLKSVNSETSVICSAVGTVGNAILSCLRASLARLGATDSVREW